MSDPRRAMREDPTRGLFDPWLWLAILGPLIIGSCLATHEGKDTRASQNCEEHDP